MQFSGYSQTQEEVGTRGAFTAISMIKPDICLVIDVASPKDTEQHNPKTRIMGNGTSICLADKTALGNRRLIKLLEDSAEKTNSPIQYDFLGGGTDAGAVQKQNVETVSVILPVRDCHKPLSYTSIKDYDTTTTLLTDFLTNPNLFK